MRRLLFCSAVLIGGLVLPSGAAAATRVDQQQNEISCSVAMTDSGASSYLGQTFTAGTSGTLTGVAFWPSGTGFGKAMVTVEVRDTVGGNPGSTVLAQASVKTNVHDRWVKITFRTGAAITAGTPYALLFHMNGGSQMVLGCAQHDPYAGGNATFTFDEGTWYPFIGEDTLPWDVAFRTYVS